MKRILLSLLIAFSLATASCGQVPGIGGMISVASNNPTATSEKILVATSNTGVTIISFDTGETWSAIPEVTDTYGRSAACSSDGQHIVIGFYNGSVWYSDDYGQTFSEILAAVSASGGMQINETGDLIVYGAGATGAYKAEKINDVWATTQLLTGNRIGVAMSSDGEYMVIGGYSLPIYTSEDYGETFILTSLTNQCYRAAMSYSGQYQLVPSNYSGYQSYLSTDYGVTFSPINPQINARSSAVSTSGQHMLLGTSNALYYSSDYGSNWSIIRGGAFWEVDIDDYGNVIAPEYNGHIYYSTDFGETWTTIYSTSSPWFGVTMTK